jgi:DNA-binding HxlR family transcriptional regulator
VQRKSFKTMACPIARSLEKVGEWWSMLILRDVGRGLTRFDQLQQALGIGSNTLARRLKALVDQGLLERRKYDEHPVRYHYVLTPSGKDFGPVLRALIKWGNKHAPLAASRPAGRRPAPRRRAAARGK